MTSLRRIPGWTGNFLKMLRAGRTETQACIAVNTRFSVVRQHRESDPEFAREMDEAIAAGKASPSKGVKW